MGPGSGRVLTTKQALRFIARNGVVLEAAKGPVPSLAAAALGPGVRGSWWGHPKAREFFGLTRAVRASPLVLVCRLIDGKTTYVHRRLWPALARLAPEIGRERLAKISEVHTASGRHEIERTPFPTWAPSGVLAAARKLDRLSATRQLGWPISDRDPVPAGRQTTDRL